MKTRIIIMLAACLLGSQVLMNAQEKGQTKERPTFEQMAQMKAERMANELALDDKTAEKFIQAYKDYLIESRSLGRGGNKEAVKAPAEKKNFKSDADVEKMLLGKFDQRQKKLDLDRKYYDKFRKFMGPKLIMKMYSLGHRTQPKAPVYRKNIGAKNHK